MEIFEEFEQIQKEAHAKGLPVIAWIYPRGQAVQNEFDRKILAYGARVGLELGADIIKMKYNGKPKDVRWMVKSAGKAKLVIAGGPKTNVKGLLKHTKEIMNAGAVGLAIGRNVWQHEHPVAMIRALRAIVHENASVDEANDLFNSLKGG